MFCTSCGKEVDAGSLFCTQCGNKIAQDQPTQSNSEQPIVHDVENTETQDTVNSEPAQDMASEQVDESVVIQPIESETPSETPVVEDAPVLSNEPDAPVEPISTNEPPAPALVVQPDAPPVVQPAANPVTAATPVNSPVPPQAVPPTPAVAPKPFSPKSVLYIIGAVVIIVLLFILFGGKGSGNKDAKVLIKDYYNAIYKKDFNALIKLYDKDAQKNMKEDKEDIEDSIKDAKDAFDDRFDKGWQRDAKYSRRVVDEKDDDITYYSVEVDVDENVDNVGIKKIKDRYYIDEERDHIDD